MKPATAPTALRVQALLGPAFTVYEFDQPTRTAQEAAEALGCAVAAIAKSVIFRAPTSDRSVLVVTSGANRVDEAKVTAVIGEPIARADAAFVREHTGYAIGGVSPVGHAKPGLVLIDADLMAMTEFWAAAGTPTSIFRLTPADLTALTGGTMAEVKQTV